MPIADHIIAPACGQPPCHLWIVRHSKAHPIEFEVSEFNDFCIDMAKSQSVLGFRPEYDIFRIVDDALQFRADGKTRSGCLYPG